MLVGSALPCVSLAIMKVRVIWYGAAVEADNSEVYTASILS